MQYINQLSISNNDNKDDMNNNNNDKLITIPFFIFTHYNLIYILILYIVVLIGMKIGLKIFINDIHGTSIVKIGHVPFFSIDGF